MAGPRRGGAGILSRGPVRLHQPQPWQELDHTADAGVVVEGATPEEALARLVLALGSVLAGRGPIDAEQTWSLRATGEDRVAVALALLRDLLYRFAVERLLPAWCEVVRLDAHGAELRVGAGRWDPALHGEGADVKAITYHAASFEEAGAGWRAQVVFDV
jgi:SHS2 domain-containing protein